MFVARANAGVVGRNAALAAKEEPYTKSLRVIPSSPCMLCLCVFVVFRLSPVQAQTSRTFGRERTRSDEKIELRDYFDSMEGVSANSCFMARGESPTARRMWRARWL